MEPKRIIDGSGREISIAKSDFDLVQANTKIHDTKFATKPTTFFKDAMKRFAKSKSAMIGGGIVGLLALLAIFVPLLHDQVGVFNTTTDGGGKALEANLPPKLFDAGTGFWDGTLKREHIVYNEETGMPVGDSYTVDSVLNLRTYEETTNAFSIYGRGGYQNVYCTTAGIDADLTSPKYSFNFANSYSINVKLLDDEFGTYVYKGIYVAFVTDTDTYYLLGDPTNPVKTYNADIDMTSALSSSGLSYAYGSIAIYAASDAEKTGNAIIESVTVTSSNSAEESALADLSFADGNSCMLREGANVWNNASGRAAYKVMFTYCDFTYDRYEYVYGKRQVILSAREILVKKNEGSMGMNIDDEHKLATTDPAELAYRFPILDESGAIYEVVEQIGDAVYKKANKRWDGFTLKVNLHQYKEYGYDAMPRYIFGTNPAAKDYANLMFTGMRLSFLIAIFVSSINIMFGLVWGSICGYFGGWVDILMERLCDIIGGLPGTVIITLTILYGRELNWGANADVIALMISLFMTGWMGVAGSTRTQFYRFKGREYVLASRTLGAKDPRLIFKHILPNAAGTIITGSVLMIPGVIYTEASIAYLKLGLQDQVLFGVILADANSNYRGDLAYQLFIPTLFMTFLLVSFNLFGNGLRDAFNPTLKGSK